MKPQDWLSIVRREYLQEFIGHGGAAVKFVVPAEQASHAQLREELRIAAQEEGFLFTFVDAASTKIHMVDKLFHAVAKQVDWDGMARSLVTQLFRENNYSLPSETDELNLQQIALLNNREENFLRKEFQTWLEKKIYKDFEMSQEFRIAMIRLCRAQVEPGVVLGAPVMEWLRGELRLISALKDALIFQKVARHNARHLLFSLAHWVKLVGRRGLVLVLDISRYTVPRRPRDQRQNRHLPAENDDEQEREALKMENFEAYISGELEKRWSAQAVQPAADDGLYYSAPATLDAYEVLRQFIDGTDEMESTFIVVIAPQAFLTDDRRGLRCYDALKLRIWDEVHDKERQNPLGSLIRLSSWREASAAVP